MASFSWPLTRSRYNDPDEFHDHTFDERRFDPSVYLVALDSARRAFAGLVRVWMDPGHPRLGLIGLTRDYRRAGLARSMVATVLRRLHERGVRSLAAEVDRGNAASNALLVSIGARRIGGTLELIRVTC